MVRYKAVYQQDDHMKIKWDDNGLFHDSPSHDGGNPPRLHPPIPKTNWQRPRDFPNLAGYKGLLSIDLETKDLDLLTRGPGWARNDGHIVGIAVGTVDGHRWYFPMRHTVCPEDNFDAENVLKWARDNLTGPQPKVGANLMYDVGWLQHEGVVLPGPYIDVQFAEPLLDEHAKSYSLDALARKYLDQTKVDDELYNWLWRAYSGKPGRTQAGNIWRGPPCLVGPYAEGDVDLPLHIWELQKKELEKQGLLELFELECNLIPLLIEMKKRGVRVDVDRAEQVSKKLELDGEKIQKQLVRMVGFNINADSNDDLKKAFDKLSLPIIYTESTKTYPNGQPSFTKSHLENVDHELTRLVLQKRKLAKTKSTFVDGYILDKSINGRVHCDFHPLRTDTNGTVSGRFSSSNPNLENIPARDPEMKRLIRGMFLPEVKEKFFVFDYSQIEYRFMVHAARGPGAEEARQRYRDDPETNYHHFTRDLIKELLGRDIEHKPVKNINFGKIFGMGKETLIKQLTGLTYQEAEKFFDAYDEAVPYAKTTARRASIVAERRGYIKTILGRHARFPFWESKNWDERGPLYPSREAAQAHYAMVQRAKTHKALNCYTQGSGADLIKMAMWLLYKEGYICLNTVHDELDFSLSPDPKIIKIIKEIMEHALKISIPILVDVECGPNWGSLKEIKT